MVSQYANNFRKIHCTAVTRIARYLRGTTNYALCYSATKDLHKLSTYIDADYAKDLDDMKSRTGLVILINGGSLLWVSRKQQCTSTSTTESEYIVASTASKGTK